MGSSPILKSNSRCPQLPACLRVSKPGSSSTGLAASSCKTSQAQTYLKSPVGRCFGQVEKASLFEFIREDGDQFYGLGREMDRL